MKNTLKKILMVSVAVSSFTGSAFAGTFAGATIGATIIAPVVVSQQRGLNFGTVAPGAAGGTITILNGAGVTATGAALTNYPSTRTTAGAIILGTALLNTGVILAVGSAATASTPVSQIVLPAVVSTLTGCDGTGTSPTVDTFTRAPAAAVTMPAAAAVVAGAASAVQVAIGVGATLHLNIGNTGTCVGTYAIQMDY